MAHGSSLGDRGIRHGAVEAVTEEGLVAGTEGLRRELLAELCGLARTFVAAMDENPGFVPCGSAFGELVEGLFAATASDDEDELSSWAEAARARAEHVSEHRGVERGAVVFPEPDDAQAALLFAAVRGIAADARRALALGRSADEVNVTLAVALAALGAGETDHDLLVHVGRAAYAAEELARP